MGLPMSVGSGRESEAAVRRVAVIADDLTGACDAAVAFADGSRSVRVNLSGQFFAADTGICAISTNTRDVPSSVAEEALRSLADQVPAGCEVFKKIDSVCRGNTFTEIAAASSFFPADLAIIAPAYPALGRRVLHGTLHVDDAAGKLEIPIADTLRADGMDLQLVKTTASPRTIARQLQLAFSSGQRVVLCDAVLQPHLEVLVEVAQSLQLRILWIGSGGLAHALAAVRSGVHEPFRLPEREGAVVLFVGSDHPATRAQTKHLLDDFGLEARDCGPQKTSEDGTDNVLFNIVRGRTTESEIQQAVAGIRSGDTSCLFMTGGDTAQLVCSALGIRSLRLLGEFERGIPIGIAEGGAWNGVPLILKSGGFGRRDVLGRVFEKFGRKERVLADA